jgi:hypothetical protein
MGGFYIVLLQEAEKTFIECAELEFCNRRTHSWPRETSYTRVRARERTSTAKSLTSVNTHNMKSSNQPNKCPRNARVRTYLTTDSESHHNQSLCFGRSHFQGHLNSNILNFKNISIQNLAEPHKKIPFIETTSDERNWGVTVRKEI